MSRLSQVGRMSVDRSGGPWCRPERVRSRELEDDLSDQVGIVGQRHVADVARLEQLRFWQGGQQARGELRLWELAIAGRPDQQHRTADLLQAFRRRAEHSRAVAPEAPRDGSSAAAWGAGIRSKCVERRPDQLEQRGERDLCLGLDSARSRQLHPLRSIG